MSEVIAKNKQWIDETFTKIDKKLQKVSVRSRNKLPYTAIDGVHNDEHTERPWWWTNGFWGGMMWLMYQETKNDTYKETAIKSGEMVNEIFGEYNRLDHDGDFCGILPRVPITVSQATERQDRQIFWQRHRCFPDITLTVSLSGHGMA